MNRTIKYIVGAVALAATIAPMALAADHDADNTARNKQITQNKEKTAENQSNDAQAVKKVAKVRRAIMDQKDLSVNAKNVKLIDESGCLVLKGPVDSEAEKDLVCKLASDVFGDKVSNQLEVKAK
jgi:hyperosmotically inducible periplasmic protein